MDWKNWAGGQRADMTVRCDTWHVTHHLTCDTCHVAHYLLSSFMPALMSSEGKKQIRNAIIFSHFPTNTKAIKMLITHNGMIPLSTAPLISADFCIQTQFVCQARDQKSQSQSWRKSNCLLFARKLEIKVRANVSWSCGQIQNMLSLARWKGNDGFDMNYEFPGRSKQNIKIN